MRWRRVVVVLVLAGLVLSPLGSAMHRPVARGKVAPLRDASWQGPDGEDRIGVTGEGVGVMNAELYDLTHPDLRDCGGWGQQYYSGVKVLRPRPRTANGHGTLTSGMICGSGQASDGLHVGVAPDVRLFANDACATIDGERMCGPTERWYRESNLRVYSQSMGDDPFRWARLVDMPADADVLFVQGAGNEGGDGSTAQTITHANQTDPRYVRVAAGDGFGTDVANYSSRGDRADPATWPHLTAPACGWSPIPLDGVPYRWTDIVSPFVGEAGCRETTSDDVTDPDSTWSGSVTWYNKGGGTSRAAPFVGGVAALMFEVHPGLAAAEAKRLLTRTADRFLATEDVDGDGEIGPDEFWDQHGYKAGYGYVDATAAVAAAHYMARHPDATVAEAVACSGTGRAEDGRLVLNPSGGPPCEASTGSEDPDGTGSSARNGDADGEAGPSTVGDPAPGGPDEGGGQDARTLSPRTVPGSGPGAVAVLAAMGVAVLAAVVWSGRRRGR